MRSRSHNELSPLEKVIATVVGLLLSVVGMALAVYVAYVLMLLIYTWKG